MLCSFQSTKVHRQRLLLKSHPVAQSTNGGDEEDRTPDPLRARQVLSQLSYTPILHNKLKVLKTLKIKQ